jgi:uncharacterized metal-binding protein
MTPRCASCEVKECKEGKDCFGSADRDSRLYGNEEVSRLHRAASAIEARHYCAEPRLQEVVLFAKELGCKRLGLAFCVGLASEAKVIEEILSRSFDVVSVCCKTGGIAKGSVGLEQIDPGKEREVMCNPAGQATLLNEAGTELNVLCGLCVGHDAIFSATSKAPVTTLIAKDRVLGHNPIGAVYCQYVRRKLEANTGGTGP